MPGSIQAPAKKRRLLSTSFFSFLSSFSRLLLHKRYYGIFHSLYCSLDPDDEAVDQLVSHFKDVINRIMKGDWKHSNIGLPLHEGKKPKYSWVKKDIITRQVFHTHPHAFFQSGLRLRILYDNILEKFCKSLTRYNYKKVTPELVASFGPTSVGRTDSGIGNLFRS